jgi:hypothetical protein
MAANCKATLTTPVMQALLTALLRMLLDFAGIDHMAHTV